MTAEAALQSLSRVAFARWKSGGESNVFLCLPRKWKKMMPVDTEIAASNLEIFVWWVWNHHLSFCVFLFLLHMGESQTKVVVPIHQRFQMQTQRQCWCECFIANWMLQETVSTDVSDVHVNERESNGKKCVREFIYNWPEDFNSSSNMSLWLSIEIIPLTHLHTEALKVTPPLYMRSLR